MHNFARICLQFGFSRKYILMVILCIFTSKTFKRRLQQQRERTSTLPNAPSLWHHHHTTSGLFFPILQSCVRPFPDFFSIVYLFVSYFYLPEISFLWHAVWDMYLWSPPFDCWNKTACNVCHLPGEQGCFYLDSGGGYLYYFISYIDFITVKLYSEFENFPFAKSLKR